MDGKDLYNLRILLFRNNDPAYFRKVYLVKTPWWLPVIAPGELIWEIPRTEKPQIYLTFDDGPHPVATPFVLDQLKSHNAQATFFCIGKNVISHPDIFQRVINEGHAIGNHTFDHLNGWKTTTEEYLENVSKARETIHSHTFRPPYGRITRRQATALKKAPFHFKIYMWSVLSGDFDINLSPEMCAKNLLLQLRPGAIVVFHDSQKAYDRLQYALPVALDFIHQKGWQMKKLET